MIPHVALGLIFHGIGGFAAASFYAPLKFIQRWPWESYYLVMGLFAWLVTPWVVAFATVPDLVEVLALTPLGVLGWTAFFGALWGVGAVTYGLTMHYLGMALGMSVTLGFCAIFGTLIPPLIAGDLGSIAATTGGRWVLAGVALCLAGILVSGAAGARKEKELPRGIGEDDPSGDAHFSLTKGLVVAFVAGLMSACFAFGFKSGAQIASIARDHGTHPLLVNNAVLCVILVGGVCTNTTWCMYLNWRRGSLSSYWSASAKATGKILLLTSAAGVIWYLQFFFYGMGMTKMGQYEFSSWSLHMSSIIIFGNLWGMAFGEWKGTSRSTGALVWSGIILLILSTLAIGWGNAAAGAIAQH